MSQPNVRVRRTRVLLREALVELIEDRGFDRVTVGDLVSRAMISRAAFYRNYRDKYELVEQIFDEAMAEMTAGNEDDTRSPSQRFADFFAHIDAYHRLYGALLGRNGSPWFADRMRSALAAMSSEHLPGRDADALAPSVISAMFVQSILWWLEHGRPCPPGEIAEQSARLIRAVIEAAGVRETRIRLPRAYSARAPEWDRSRWPARRPVEVVRPATQLGVLRCWLAVRALVVSRS